MDPGAELANKELIETLIQRAISNTSTEYEKIKRMVSSEEEKELYATKNMKPECRAKYKELEQELTKFHSNLKQDYLDKDSSKISHYMRGLHNMMGDMLKKPKDGELWQSKDFVHLCTKQVKPLSFPQFSKRNNYQAGEYNSGLKSIPKPITENTYTGISLLDKFKHNARAAKKIWARKRKIHYEPRPHYTFTELVNGANDEEARKLTKKFAKPAPKINMGAINNILERSKRAMTRKVKRDMLVDRILQPKESVAEEENIDAKIEKAKNFFLKNVLYTSKPQESTMISPTNTNMTKPSVKGLPPPPPPKAKAITEDEIFMNMMYDDQLLGDLTLKMDGDDFPQDLFDDALLGGEDPALASIFF